MDYFDVSFFGNDIRWENQEIEKWIENNRRIILHSSMTMIDYAAWCIKPDVIKFLHAKGERCSPRAIELASSGGHISIVKLLHTLGMGFTGGNALRGASASGHLEVVKFLCSVDDGLAFTPSAIEHAAHNGHLEIIKFMIDKYTKKCITTTSIKWAALNCHLEVVKYLCAERDTKSTSLGCTESTSLGCAMDAAAGRGHIEIVKFLFSIGGFACSPEGMDKAAQNGHLEVVKFLHTEGLYTEDFYTEGFCVFGGPCNHLEVANIVREKMKRVNDVNVKYG